MEGVTRRHFLKSLGWASGLMMAIDSGLLDTEALARVEEELEQGVETWVPTVCQQCSGGCGIRVRLIAGWPVKITGNPLHPVNRGTICPKGEAGLQALYDPDRIKGPLRRKGRRGSNNWEEISWDEAIRTVAGELLAIRDGGDAHTVAIMGGRYRGLMRTLLERFLRAYGSPNYIDNRFLAEQQPVEAMLLAQGVREEPVYDLENSNYILSFGVGLLESFWSPVQALRAWGHVRRGRPGLRAKIVQIEPRFSITAAKADEWIPINPGTEGVLALGIAHMMVKEGLYDSRFVRDHSFGFEDWEDSQGNAHRGFRTSLMEDYEPAVVSKTTGVPVETIIRLAREFVATKPSLAIGKRNGVYDQFSVHSLNALAGSIEVPGGVLRPRKVPLAELPPIQIDGVAEKGLEMPRIDGAGSPQFPLASHVPGSLPRALKENEPYPLGALFLHYTNPLFSSPNGGFQEMERVHLIVSFSPFMDESTRLADLILPDHCYLERWQDDPTHLTTGFPLLGMRQPVIKPLYNTMHTGDVIIKMANEMGGGIASSFPWKDFREVLVQSVKGTFEAKRGNIFGPIFEEAWTKLLQKGGWWAPTYQSFEQFWDQALEKGGWWDPIYYFGEWENAFNTPSGRFEFYSQTLKGLGSGSVARDTDEGRRAGTGQGGAEDIGLMPHYEPKRVSGQDGEYPFFLNVYKLMTITGGRNANQPWLTEIVGPHVKQRWSTWAEINPEAASELGIGDGDWIMVESPFGKIKVRAKLYPGAMPEVVSIPFGLGRKSYGRWAKGIGANPHSLLSDRMEPLTGHPMKDLVRVRISKL
ncbi:MAG: molybdopterin-dependent oxidoreductase [Proteobacteria bacterium]|nr:molybdopterin-dependent oxidoreductase [Pseudomonadota bacterium]